MKIFFLICFLVSFFTLRAEETIPQTLKNDFLSPARDINKNYYLWGAGGILVGEIFFQKLEKNLQKSMVKNRPLGDSSYGDKLGQGIPNIIYFLGMELAGDRHKAELMLRSTLVSGLTTDVLKYTIREKRPSSNAKNSFPSGHTTMAFSFASTVGALHGKEYGIPAYLMASFVGFSRINDNKHYFFDVAAGALMGTMYGISIVNRDVNLNSKEAKIVDFIPVITKDLVGINCKLSY